MTLLIKATGQPAELEEVTEDGFYLRVQGHSRFFPPDAVQHPKPTCPKCDGELLDDYEPALRTTYRACQNPDCFFEYRLGE